MLSLQTHCAADPGLSQFYNIFPGFQMVNSSPGGNNHRASNAYPVNAGYCLRGKCIRAEASYRPGHPPNP